MYSNIMDKNQNETNINIAIREIKTKIRLSMNGTVAQSIRDKGISYKSNLGVEIPRLKEIAASYTPDAELAKKLWETKSRETMILATILMPIDNFSKDKAIKWIEDIATLEIAEIGSMYLFSRLPYATELALENIESEEIFQQITGFLIFTRIYKQLDSDIIRKVIERSIYILPTNNFQVYNSIGICLSKLCRKDKETSNIIYKSMSQYKKSEDASCKFVLDKIEQEIDFLEF